MSERKRKGRPMGGHFAQHSNSIYLPDHRRIRARQRHRLASFNDVGGLGVIRIAARGDTEASHRDAGHERNNHDLQMRAAIR
jgi:hypothetical protein